MQDTFEIEVLPDGTLKAGTDKFSPQQHMSAETFLKTLGGLLGGSVKRTRKAGAPMETHQHNGQWHTH